MEIVYRALGITAAVSSWASRIRFNFIRLHWLAMIGVGIALGGLANEVRYAYANEATPRAITVAQALAHDDPDHNFVAVRGTLIDEVAFQETKTRRGTTTVEASYYPLASAADRRVLLVRAKGSRRVGSAGERELVGMLMPIDGDLRKELLRAQRDAVDPFPVDVDYVLEAGRRPADRTVSTLTLLFVAALMLAMLMTWRTHFVVFRPSAAALRLPDGGADETAPAPTFAPDRPAPDLQVSGTFTLTGQRPRRFLAVPAAFAVRSGVPQFEALIDASTRFFGIKTADRVGIWKIALPSDAIGAMEPGYQYLGMVRRPALRIHHTLAGSRVTTVVSCADTSHAQALAVLLRYPQTLVDDGAAAE